MILAPALLHYCGCKQISFQRGVAARMGRAPDIHLGTAAFQQASSDKAVRRSELAKTGYLEGFMGHFVSKLLIRILTIPLVTGVINLLTKSPWPSKYAKFGKMRSKGDLKGVLSF